jgi:hypothetical protein
VSDVEVHENPYFHTGDIWKHNTEVDELMERCDQLFPVRGSESKEIEDFGFGDIAKRDEVDHWTIWERLSDAERAKREEAGCGRNQTTLIILPSLWFAEAYSGSATGEAVYAQSIVSTSLQHDRCLLADLNTQCSISVLFPWLVESRHEEDNRALRPSSRASQDDLGRSRASQ